ncbi:hypothetical protein M8542_47710 [Amycolatopsis sp. OK19-0408]|uniref:Uncharacterized protein n=1 Tax=Amycolatopsis iheyensis TaxID=2945988 RepID=A0A9X2NPG8_9PSEU|nr:hypothetical protein [Amycolatopsis iheyensis]MCR6490517.1 hypothetical protein [Amycolatopsis iheyensis]
MFYVVAGVALDGMSGGFGFPFGCVAAVVAVLVADVAGATGSPWYALVTLGSVVLFSACRTSVLAAFGVAVVAWALQAGFVLGRAGELSFSPASAVAAGVFGLALLAGALASLAPPVRIPAPRVPASRPASRTMTPVT